jgi:hypothetical protein
MIHMSTFMKIKIQIRKKRLKIMKKRFFSINLTCAHFFHLYSCECLFLKSRNQDLCALPNVLV